METLLQDVRYGFRMLVKNPAFTAVAVLTLAIGIGANTTIFTVVNAVLLNPLPVGESDRVVTVNTVDAKNSTTNFRLLPVSYQNLRDIRDHNDVFSGMAIFTFTGLSLSGNGEP